MRKHPGRVERVGRVSERGSPALAGSLPYPHPLTEGKRTGTRTRRAGCPTARGAALLFACRSVSRWWRGGGEVVARWWRWLRPEPDGVAALPLGDGVDGEDSRRNGREARNWRRCRRHPSPWFSLSSCSVCSFVLPLSACFVSLSIYNKVYYIIANIRYIIVTIR